MKRGTAIAKTEQSDEGSEDDTEVRQSLAVRASRPSSRVSEHDRSESKAIENGTYPNRFCLSQDIAAHYVHTDNDELDDGRPEPQVKRERGASDQEEDQLESDGDNESSHDGGRSQRLRNSGAICVQWPGPVCSTIRVRTATLLTLLSSQCDQCKEASKNCVAQDPPKRRCNGCQFSSRPKKCTYNGVNTYGEVKGKIPLRSAIWIH